LTSNQSLKLYKMKNLLLLLMLFPITCSLQAQQMDADSSAIIWTYAELVGISKLLSSKVTVEIDYGQENKVWSFQDDRIIDPSTGKTKSFNSMVDAMNFMGALGWEFVQAYVLNIGYQNVYHWLLKIQVEKNAVGNYVPLTRNETKKMKSKN